MVFVLAVALALQPQDLPSRVAEQVAHLASEDPRIRTAATDALVRLGRRAIPALEATKSDDPEVRSRVARAISRIQTTDPFYLVRSAERRVSVEFRDLPFPLAHDRAFAGFPVSVPPSEIFLGANRVSLTTDKAGYWEVVEKFAGAAQVRLAPGGEVGLCLEARLPEKGVQFVRHGRFLAVGSVTRGRVWVQLYAEPGLQPVDVTFKLSELTDGTGASLLKKIVVDQPSWPWVSTTPFPGGTLAVFPAPAERAVVNIEGKAFVDLPTDVEAIEFRAGNETRALSEWQVSVDGLKFEQESFSFRIQSEELKAWKTPEERRHLGTVWIIVADDEGRSRTVGTMGYGRAGHYAIQSGWNFPNRATRLSFVRPTAVERVEFPVSLRGITVLP